MPDQNDPRLPGTAITPVPDLIERYRVRRDEWIAQADELARLRDEVRGAAEREAMEIVTAARRDVRQVIMEARRELLVLSAQVQAALGEVNGKGDPASLLGRGSVPPPPGLPASGSSEPRVENLVPESAVKTMLDEARADMEALAEDAKTVPFQSTPLASSPAADHAPVFPRAVPDAALPTPLDAALASFDATQFPGSRDQQPKDNFPDEVTSSLLIDQGNSFIDDDRDDARGDEDHRRYERPAPI